MRILFLSQYKWPHLGGVELHVYKIGNILKEKGNILELVSGVDIGYPEIKYLGLLSIWLWFFKKRCLFKKAQIIHCHDVFVWCIPFYPLLRSKKVITTFHGWEERCPMTRMSIFQKRLAVRFSKKTIGVGKFLEKYLNVKFDLITYGASSQHKGPFKKNKNTIVYVGRLEENTGLLQFLKWLKVNGKGLKVEFCGDGNLRSECEKYGLVHGFTKPDKYYKTAGYCVPGGYLAALEALSYNCKLKLFWNNQIKEDYWKMSPFYKLKGEELKSWAKKQTWEKLANEYLDLYKFSDKRVK